jgi:hypothetical protein
MDGARADQGGEDDSELSHGLFLGQPERLCTTLEVLAIIDVARGAKTAELRKALPEEIKGSWGLFASGVLPEAYATASPTRVVFVLEAENGAAAEAQLRSLPMVAAGSMRVEYVELRPFVNWSALFAH